MTLSRRPFMWLPRGNALQCLVDQTFCMPLTPIIHLVSGAECYGCLPLEAVLLPRRKQILESIVYLQHPLSSAG